MRVEILNPAGRPRQARHTMAPRPTSLDGLRLGLLDNGKSNADVILRDLGDLLGQRFRLEGVVYIPRRQPGVDWWRRNPHGPDAIVEKVARECDVVVNGVGD